MAGNQLALTNIVNISVSQSQAGAGEYNTSNIGLFSVDTPAMNFGSLGYKIYTSPQDVGIDFGTSSVTYEMANSIFSQKPNILAGNGYLTIIPFQVAVQHLAFSAAPSSGTYVLNFAADSTAAVNFDDTAAEIQTKVRTLNGLEQAVVTGTAATSINITFDGYYGPAALITVTSNTLNGSISITVTTTTAGETLAGAITRTESLVQYFGILSNVIEGQSDMLAAAAVVQAINKIAFFVNNDPASIAPGGQLDLLRTGDFTQSRGIFYGSNTTSDALVMVAAYAGRGLSVNFTGSNTTITMHLKDLLGIQPDPIMTQTLLTEAQAAGADVYASFQGVAKTFCSGANEFFDQVYNLQWFAGSLQIAGFNFLAQSATKVPQTEQGMDGLKSAYRNVCEQAVTNQYSAPGIWNSSTTFGNQSDFLANVQQRGYYIYSQPIAQQQQSSRAARQAPLVQIALKEAGAIHSSNVIVYVNA